MPRSIFSQDGNTQQLGVQLPIHQFEKWTCFRPCLCMQGMGAGPVATVTSSTVSSLPSPNLPHGWWQKSCHCHYLLRHSKQSKPETLWQGDLQDSGAAGWEEGPSLRDKPLATGILGEFERVISPTSLPQLPPLESISIPLDPEVGRLKWTLWEHALTHQ